MEIVLFVLLGIVANLGQAVVSVVARAGSGGSPVSPGACSWSISSKSVDCTPSSKCATGPGRIFNLLSIFDRIEKWPVNCSSQEFQPVCAPPPADRH